MKMKSILLIFPLSLSFYSDAIGQICSVSEYPYGFAGGNFPLMHGSKFMTVSEDLSFIGDDKRKNRYSQFWINADVLNVRSGPNLQHNIISETYHGNLVFAFAKKGEWVAISKGYSNNNIEVQPEWVSIRYLSPNQISKQVDTSVLQNKCSFKTYGELDLKTFYNRTHGTYSSCAAVLKYLRQQHLLSVGHSYN